jgi:hypothetical protein
MKRFEKWEGKIETVEDKCPRNEKDISLINLQ